MSELTKNISNSDITWDADFVGLAPTVTGDDARFILEDIENPISDLLLALSDPDKFVAAHVLLTNITGVRYETSPPGTGWMSISTQQAMSKLMPNSGISSRSVGDCTSRRNRDRHRFPDGFTQVPPHLVTGNTAIGQSVVLPVIGAQKQVQGVKKFL